MSPYKLTINWTKVLQYSLAAAVSWVLFTSCTWEVGRHLRPGWSWEVSWLLCTGLYRAVSRLPSTSCPWSCCDDERTCTSCSGLPSASSDSICNKTYRLYCKKWSQRQAQYNQMTSQERDKSLTKWQTNHLTIRLEIVTVHKTKSSHKPLDKVSQKQTKYPTVGIIFYFNVTL